MSGWSRLGYQGSSSAAPVYYDEQEKLRLEESIMSIVKKEFGRVNFAIITNMDFGRTDPHFIIPLGT